MGTRSYIGRMIDGQINAVYCHWDGYPEGVGATLISNYGEKEVDGLLELGGFSSLKETVEETAKSAYREEVFVAESKFDYYRNSPFGDIEYSYLFDGGRWTVYDHANEKELDLLNLLI
jgi:hypothetical protein